MGYEDKALAIAVLVVTINAVLLFGLGTVGIDFSNDNLFTWIDSAVVGKAELAANTTFSNSKAVDLNAEITLSGTKAEGTGSTTTTISFFDAAVTAAFSVITAIPFMLFGSLYIMDFLHIPLAIQVIIGVPLSAFAMYGFFYLIIGIVAAITGALRG